jgi:hypothetical protein
MQRGLLVCLTLVISAGVSVEAAEPLHQRIDALITAAHKGPVAPRSSDAEFLRRVSLDFAGLIPTAAEARSSLADKSPDKRTKLIDRLLSGADYPQRMQYAFSTMLLERRPGLTVAMDDWNQYLQTSFKNNKPLDQLIRELISADGTDPATRPAMKFLLARSATDHRLLARDVSRLLLGRNLECAQCHDHPTIDDYKQADFFGLVAFLDRSYLYKDKKTNESFFIEKGTGPVVEFTSVFTTITDTTGPKLLWRDPVDVPVFEKGQELKTPATEGKPPVPKLVLRPQLAEQLTAPNNAEFSRNMANRLWALMMGRGLVHPLDMQHESNKPSHPKLLTLLAEELVAGKFDIKRLLREIALSEVYQRSSQLGDEADDVPVTSYAAFNMKSLSAEQLAFSVMQAAGRKQEVLAVPADKAATAKYRPDKGRPIPAVNLDNVLKLFRSVFAAQPGQSEDEFSPSVAAALFAENEGLLLDWLTLKDANLQARLAKLSDARAVTEELYMSVLTRLPTEEEREAVTKYLEANADDRATSLREMAWALLASAEFRFNH